MSYKPRLKEEYNTNVKEKLRDKFSYSTDMAIPKILKIAINQGIGEGTTDKKLIDKGIEELTAITGQRAVPTMSKKDISNFKLRKGMPVGARVTLRGDVMYEFLDRLITVAIPRIRDFKGISPKGFDGHGNFTFGLTEQIVFPEINLDEVSKINGFNITFVTTAKNDNECYELLKAFGFPFINQNQ